MSTLDLPGMTLEELGALEVQLRDDIDVADKEHNVVSSHDLRCLLDQVVAAQADHAEN